MKKKVFITGLLFAMAILLAAQAPGWSWLSHTGGTGECLIFSSETDSQNRIIIAGSFSGTVTFGNQPLSSNGMQDAFIAQLDMQGNWLWAMSFGGPDNDYATQISIDEEDRIYVGGLFAQTLILEDYEFESHGGYDIFCAKFSSDGQLLAATHFGSAFTDQINGISVNPLGNVYLCGSFRDSISFGDFELTAQGLSGFITKLDSNFEPVWAQQPSNVGGSLEFRSIGSDANDNCYITGSFYYQCTIGYPNTLSLYSENQSGFVVKLSGSGNAVWAERVGAANSMIVSGCTDKQGNTYLTTDIVIIIDKGETRLDLLPRFAKINSSGTWMWTESYANMESCFYTRIYGDAQGNCYLTGLLWGDVVFGNYALEGNLWQDNIFVAKGDANGNWQWAIQTYNANYSDYRNVVDISALDNGGCVIVGTSKEALDFDDFSLPESPNRYGFIIGVNIPSSDADDQLSPQIPANITIWPNPSRGAVQFRIETEKSPSGSIGIYNLKGQMVKSFPPNAQGQDGTLNWDGLDEHGRLCSSGIYFINVKSGYHSLSKKFILCGR